MIFLLPTLLPFTSGIVHIPSIKYMYYKNLNLLLIFYVYYNFYMCIIINRKVI